MKRVHQVFCRNALFIATMTSPAYSQSVEEDALIARGIEQRRRGEDEAALRSFTRAWELGHGARARAQMAFAEYALDRWTDAETHLREALAGAGNPWIESHRAEFMAQMDTIERHIGSVEATSNAPGTELWLAGRRVGTLPLTTPLRLNEGTVTLEARAVGYRRCAREVVVTHGAPVRVSFGCERIPPPPRNPLGLVMAGVGGAAVVTGAVAWFVAGSMCQPGYAGCGVAPASVGDVRTLDTVANVGLWGGLGLIAVGTTLYVLRIPSSGDSASRRAAVVIGPGSLSVVGSF